MGDLEVLRDPASVAERAAELVVEAARVAIRDRGRFSLALSGGATPKLFHQVLASPRLAAQVDWPKVHIFYSDERAVPAEHEGSNHRVATETLLARVPIPAANVHRVEGDDGDAEKAAARYLDVMGHVLGSREALPDLVVLGMGEDGHTASLFPGSAPREGEESVIATVAPPSSPIPARVTFSYSALARAARVLVMVTGPSKAARLAEVLRSGSSDGDGSSELPMRRVLRSRAGASTLLVDRAAAAHLDLDSPTFHPNSGERTMSTGIQQADFGLIGLGVMGENLALNIEEKGFSIAVFNRTTEKVDEFVARNPGKRIVGTHSLEGFVKALSRPRRMIIMVKAGAAVDATIQGLLPFLEAGDVVIDGGNEHFTNTERRTKELEPKGLDIVGMGVSGGEEGARHGPSLMPGGSKAAYEKIRDVVTKIAAQVADGPCVTHIGPGGAGHYVKMVHNGIEYGDMQLIAEAYDVLKNVGGLSNEELAEAFTAWNGAELESFLIEITAQIFRKKDDLTGKALVDVILDAAQMKGTGSWTVKEGADLQQSIPTIASSVDARIMSAGWALRQKGASLLAGPTPTVGGAEKSAIVADARAALYAAKACSYAQGLALLAKASATYGWHLDLGEIARIWKGGCIIRAAFLGRIQAAFGRDTGLENLLFDTEFRAELAARQDGWRRTIMRAVQTGIAVPTMTASLAYYDGLRRARMPMNLTQAQRDFFGAHTYQRIDRDGVFHSEWT